jgi:hypothetical protein
MSSSAGSYHLYARQNARLAKKTQVLQGRFSCSVLTCGLDPVHAPHAVARPCATLVRHASNSLGRSHSTSAVGPAGCSVATWMEGLADFAHSAAANALARQRGGFEAPHLGGCVLDDRP